MNVTRSKSFVRFWCPTDRSVYTIIAKPPARPSLAYLYCGRGHLSISRAEALALVRNWRVKMHNRNGYYDDPITELSADLRNALGLLGILLQARDSK